MMTVGKYILKEILDAGRDCKQVLSKFLGIDLFDPLSSDMLQ